MLRYKRVSLLVLLLFEMWEHQIRYHENRNSTVACIDTNVFAILNHWNRYYLWLSCVFGIAAAVQPIVVCTMICMWQCGVYLCHVCDVILFRLYFGIRKLPAQFVIIILELLHYNKQNSHFSSSRWYQINFLIIIIASLPLLSVFSYFRSIVRSFIISFSSLHIPVSISFIHMPSTFYWLYTVTASHTYICTFIELYSTYSQPPGQTIVNKQNNERTSAVIMQKATTNAIKQLIWWCAVCMANVSESLCVSVSMPISRDDIHTDSNLIMQCIQRTPLLPVFQSLDEMYTHKHTLCSAEFHHRHKCVQTLHKYTWTVGTTGGKMRLKTVRQKRNPRMRMCQGKINKKKMYAIIS